MKRRVVKHGPSSLIISMPSKWCEKHNIVKGKELDVTEDEGRLVISSDTSSKLTERDIDITGLDRTTIMYCVRGLYRLGYDTININFNKPTAYYQREGRELSIASILHTEVNRLVGFEIMNERQDSCVVKDLQETSLKDFDQVLRRLFILLTDMMKEFVDAAKSNDQVLLETMENKHDTITKFVSYCLRILNKKGSPVPGRGYQYFYVISTVDRITDIVKYAARDLRKYNKKPNPKVLKILETVAHDFEQYYHFFYKFDNNAIVQINDSRYQAEKDLRLLPKNLDTVEIIVATNMFHILEVLLDLIEVRTALEY